MRNPARASPGLPADTGQRGSAAGSPELGLSVSGTAYEGAADQLGSGRAEVRRPAHLSPHPREFLTAEGGHNKRLLDTSSYSLEVSAAASGAPGMPRNAVVFGAGWSSAKRRLGELPGADADVAFNRTDGTLLTPPKVTNR